MNGDGPVRVLSTGAAGVAGPPTPPERVSAQLSELDQRLAETCEVVDHLHHKLLGPSPIGPIPENPSETPEGIFNTISTRLSDISVRAVYIREVLQEIQNQT